jgi:hypothetical protein
VFNVLLGLGKTVGEACVQLLVFVQVGAANGEPIAVALILVLRVKPDVGGTIDAGSGSCHWQTGFGDHSEGAELEDVLASLTFVRRSEVRRAAVDRLRIHRVAPE